MKLLNWRMKMTNYKFDDSDKTVQPVPIIITEGKYEGMKVQYGRISFDEGEGELSLQFDYRLCENPNEIEEDQDFVNVLGDILMNVLEEEMIDVGEDFLKETIIDENG